MKINIQGFDFSFTDSDIANQDDWIPLSEYNPHNVRPWLLHDHGLTVCVVFADSLQDALDIAVDNNKMELYLIADSDFGDREDEEGITFLGNASEPFDIESLGVVELPNPPRSWCAQLEAMTK
jgi:hypothetical protein